MDMIRIKPTMLRGKVQVPPSKSVAHRALIAAALSGMPCTISNIVLSKDMQATLDCIKQMGIGFDFDPQKGEVFFTGEQHEVEDILGLHCEESGSTLRFMIPITLLSGKRTVFSGKGRLMSRPQKPYMDIFREKGISCTLKGDKMVLDGKLESGIFSLPGDVSSQFVTGLMFALPLLDGDSEVVITTHMESKGYIDLTLSVLKEFGIRIINENYQRFVIPGGQSYCPVDYVVEGDYSQAAFFLVAGALGCDLVCSGLKEDSLQGDKKILELIERAGAKIVREENGDIRAVATGDMKCIEIDAREIPDLVPVLAVLCGFLSGESRIINAGRLRMKESDRLAAISQELSRLGLDIEEGEDYLKIQGTQVLAGETVSAWNDHRIAMSMAIAACRCEGDVLIDGGEKAVQKSYPDFFEVYENLQDKSAMPLCFEEEIAEKG